MILVIILSFGTFQLKAQTKLDSLYTIWQDGSESDSVRVVAYKNYIWYGFMFSHPDSAFVLSTKLVEFSNERNYALGKATGVYNQGVSHYVQSNYPKALRYFQQCLNIYKSINSYKGISSSINNIGNIYSVQGDYNKSLELYFQSEMIAEEAQDEVGKGYVWSNIGNIYYELGDHDRSFDYYQKSLSILEEAGDQRGIAMALGGIALYYQSKEDYPVALDYMDQCIKIFQALDNQTEVAAGLAMVGNIHQMQGNYQVALENCDQALLIAEKLKVLNRRKDACECLYNTYKAMGNGNQALVYLEKLNVLSDSMNQEEIAKKLQQMEFQKEMLADSIATAEEKRIVEVAHQKEVRQKNRTRNILAVSGLLAFLVAGGFYSRWRYVRKSRDIISKEKDRSENLLLNILPAEIAEELKEKGEAQARDFEMVSILFTDFKGFTEASAKLSAAKLVEEINTCFKAFDAIAGKYNVEKIKTIGDSYMAAGGLPVPDDSATKKTVLAALEMQAFIIDRKASRDKEGLPAFSMRVGIHTGSVVAGIVGVKKFQYDIWGDTVNTASRIESNGEAGKVNISQATYEILKNDPDFAFESRGKIEAKGKGEMEMWFVSLE
ncbi:MAG: tetratricopeptide repeat protein [Flavobacteriales bacterium]|nr:tetratricopeptide repeat protein [Flavobacteriales bacterium]